MDNNMVYVYFKDPKGNFGDDINGWLWPKIFGEEALSQKIAFLGIGSILNTSLDLINDYSNYKKIVFGTGVRYGYNSIKVNSDWDIRFLRGPLSVNIIDRNLKYISDSAYAFRQIEEFQSILNTKKKYKVSLIPHISSCDIFNWKSLCDQLGYNYISPRAEKGLEYTLKEIASSEKVITEAMHGAIFADLFRIPWRRFILSTPYGEGAVVSEFKWLDWQFSVKVPIIDSIYIPKYKVNGKLSRLLRTLTFNKLESELLMKGRVEEKILRQLSNLSEFVLSEEKVIKTIDEKIFYEVDKLKKDLDGM